MVKFAYMKFFYKHFEIVVSEMITGNATNLNHLAGVYMIVKLNFAGKIVTILDDYNFHTEQALCTLT